MSVTIYEAFVASAQNSDTANNVCVIDPSDHYTFAQFYEKTEAIRVHLHNRDVDYGDVVGLLLERDVHLPATIMAVFGTGAAYIPLEVGEPSVRHVTALKICPCKTVVCERSEIGPLERALKDEGVSPLPHFIDIEDILPPTGDIEPPRQLSPDTLAYVLMTSGSTGTPKAVRITHGNIAAHVASAIEVLKFTGEDRYLATTPMSFDPSIAELFLPMATGGAIVIRDRTLIFDPQLLARTISENCVTVAASTPSTWSTIFSNIDAFPHLRAIITHGEPISPEFARILATKADMAMNLYGPTEATVWATGHQLLEDAPENVSKTSAPIGNPLMGFTIQILDTEGLPVACSNPGELVLGGPNIADGYLNDPDRTAQVFFEEDGVKFYRTGDLVQQSESGVIEYMGRIDDQMAIKGQRIEPGEIETAILSHPWIERAAVTWYNTKDDQRGIMAGVVSAENQSINEAGVRMYLASLLRTSMIPTRYLILNDLPSLVSGKVDRTKLRNMLTEGVETTAETEIQATPTEAKLCAIWADTLSLESVKPSDEFFLIGGDSLSAVEMVSKVEADVGVSLPVIEIFEVPKLSDFAAKIDTMTSTGSVTRDDSDRNVIRTTTDKNGYPLFFVLANYGYAGKEGKRLTAPFINVSIWDRRDGVSTSDSLEQFSRSLVEEIRAHQPNGPYRLGGYSIGGLIVFEMARQLVEAGEEIATLFLLDPTMPNAQAEKLRQADENSVNALQRLVTYAAFAAKRIKYKVRHAKFWWIHRRINKMARAGDRSAIRELQPQERLDALLYATTHISHRYLAKPLDDHVPTTLVSSSSELTKTWVRIISPDSDVHTLEFNHRAMFQPPADAIWTDILNEVLEKDGTGKVSFQSILPTQV